VFTTKNHVVCFRESFGYFVVVVCRIRYCKVKGKCLPYSLPSVGPGADPVVQAVSPQVT